jgi:UrcA family protein
MLKLTLPMLLLGAAVPSLAAAQDSRMIRVSAPVIYSDLNLATDRGVALLDQRIDAAVRRVCGPTTNSNWMERLDIGNCRRRAREANLTHRAQVIAAYRDGREPVRLAVFAR